MNVYILTGPGEVGKRQHLLQIKRQFDKTAITEYDLKTHDLTTVKDALLSTPLFTNTKLVILENPPAALDLAEFTISAQLTLVILIQQLPVSSSLFKSAKEVKAKLIDFAPQKELSAFPFIDALIEKKGIALFELMKLLEQYGAMYVFSMIYYLLRRNILPLPKNNFTSKKIAVQKRKYKLTDFTIMYQKTLETEYKIKSGLISDTLGLTRLVQLYILI